MADALLTCPHLATGKRDGGEPLRAKARPHLACPHLIRPTQLEVVVRFHAHDGAHDVLCPACHDAPEMSLYEVCQDCWRAMMAEHDWDDNLGVPAESRDSAGVLIGEPEVLLSVTAPPSGTCGQIMLTARQREALGVLSLAVSSDLELWAGSATSWVKWRGLDELPREDERAGPPELSITLSSRGDHVFIARERTEFAVLYHIASDGELEHVHTFSRGDYHVEHCRWAAAFVDREDGETVLVCASDWNRMDVYDVASAASLTARETEADDDDEKSRSLDFFFCTLHASRDGRWLANTGWVWHPVGVVNLWSLERWLDGNPYESEDGPSKLSPNALVTDDWDKPFVWLDGSRFVSWGISRATSEHQPGLTVMDAEGGKLLDLIGLATQDCAQLWWTGIHVAISRGNGDVTLVDLTRGAIVHEVRGHNVIAHIEGDRFVSGAPGAAWHIVRIPGA